MPGSKNYKNKKYYSKSKKPKDKTVSHKIELVDKKVKKLQSEIELKTRHFDIPFTTVNNVWTSLVLANGLTQGTGDGQRVGDRARFTSIRITGEIQRDFDNIEPNSLRCLVFWDSQPNQSNPPVITTANSLFNIPTNANNVCNATYNIDTQKRYKILLDKRFVLNSPNVDSGDAYWPTRQLFNFYIKLGRETVYSGTTGTIADITKNSLYIAWCTDQTDALGSEWPFVRYAFAIYYKDA